MASQTRTHEAIAAVLVGFGLATAPVALGVHSAVELVDNSEYVTNALEPLIDDPVVQEQLVDQSLEPLTEAFTSEAVINLLVDAGTIPDSLSAPLGELANPLLQPVLDSLEQQIVNTARYIVSSDAFAESWRGAVGDSHRSFQDAIRSGEDITIGLPLRPLLEIVRDDLAASGFAALERIPIPEVSAPLFTVDPPQAWQERYQLASALDPWLAVIAIGLTGAGVWFSPRRGLTWVVIGAATPLVTVVPVVATQWWIASLPASLPNTAAGALLGGPLATAGVISAVVVLTSATGWFIERSRRPAIA